MCEHGAVDETERITSDEARQKRSKIMVTLGVIALIWGAYGFVAGSSTGSPAGLLIALLGIGLIVGGLVIRR